MPSTAWETLDLLLLKQLGPDSFEGKQPAASVLHKVYGGQVAAQLLAAANATVSQDRDVHALHVNFLLPGDWSLPIRCEVDRVRDGGSFSSRQMAAWQDGRRIATASSSYQRPEMGLRHGMPIAVKKGPEDSEDLFDVANRLSDIPAELWRREFGAFEMRLAEAELSNGCYPQHRGAQKIWFRFRGVTMDSSEETLLLTYISDFSFLGASLTPHGMFLGSEQIHRATLNHSIWYHAQPHPSEWFLYDQESTWAGGGRGFVTAKVFNQQGEMVATTAQEGLIRPLGERHKSLDDQP